MNLKSILAAGAAAAVLATAGEASAALIWARMWGEVTSSSVFREPFGLGGQLTGQDIFVQLLLDTDIGNRASNDFGGSWYDSVTGFDATSPILSADIRINGYTDALDFTLNGVASGPGSAAVMHDYSLPNAVMLYGETAGYRTDGWFRRHKVRADVFGALKDAPHDLETPWVSRVAGDFGSIRHDDPGISYLANFRIDRMTFSPAPEPAAWALMILGFGAAGAMLRARRRLVAL